MTLTIHLLHLPLHKDLTGTKDLSVVTMKRFKEDILSISVLTEFPNTLCRS